MRVQSIAMIWLGLDSLCDLTYFLLLHQDLVGLSSNPRSVAIFWKDTMSFTIFVIIFRSFIWKKKSNFSLAGDYSFVCEELYLPKIQTVDIKYLLFHTQYWYFKIYINKISPHLAASDSIEAKQSLKACTTCRALSIVKQRGGSIITTFLSLPSTPRMNFFSFNLKHNKHNNF